MTIAQKIIIPLFCFMVLGAGCQKPSRQSAVRTEPSPHTQNEQPATDQTKVCASVYSGRNDDPCWVLSANDAAKLISMVQVASTTTWKAESETGLGYRGLIVFLPSSNKLTGRPMTQLSIFSGRLAFNKDESAMTDSRGYFNEPNPHLTYKLDNEGAIEAWLLALGRFSVAPDIYKSIEDTWNKNVQGTETRKTLDGISWKTYLNDHYGFSIQYPPDWSIRSKDKNSVVFDVGFPETHESIEYRRTTSTLEEYLKTLVPDPTVILTKNHILLDGLPALRVDTTEFGRTLIIAPDVVRVPGDGFYVIQTGGRMIENGMLNTVQTSPNASIDVSKTYSSKILSLKYPADYTVKESGDMLIVSNAHGKIVVGGFRPSIGYPISEETKSLPFRKIVYTGDLSGIPTAWFYQDGDTKIEAELGMIFGSIQPLNR